MQASIWKGTVNITSENLVSTIWSNFQKARSKWNMFSNEQLWPDIPPEKKHDGCKIIIIIIKYSALWCQKNAFSIHTRFYIHWNGKTLWSIIWPSSGKAFVKGSSYCYGQRKLIQSFGDCFESVLYGRPRVNSTSQSFHPMHRPEQWQACTMR